MFLPYLYINTWSSANKRKKLDFNLFIFFENFLNEMLSILRADLTLILHIHVPFLGFFGVFLISYSR